MKLTKNMRRLVPAGVLVLSSAALVGCGPITFQGQSGLKIVGELPPPPTPPPPPPKKEMKRVRLVDNKIVINEKIQFAYDKAVILEVSNSLMTEIAKILKDNPHVKKVSIEGHASDEGRGAASANYNKALSDRRAKAVMTDLVGKGIDAKRLTAKGWGIEKPIGSNDDDAGREKNRRVEFHVTEQDVTKKEIPVKEGKK
jgi:outer membrane protein OmpA-like peptidoglycan-associated protein